jgi:[acyl-carrier-protein] S-malonyltransferase
MIALVFPGQGSQKVGMGRALADAFPAARATFEEADDALGERLSELIWNGPEDALTLTENTQPAILTASIAAFRVLESEGLTTSVAFMAGHSLGEYAAYVAAGTFAFADAVQIVRRRGRYMQEAVPAGTGAMAAILGLDPESVTQACLEAANGEVVSPANINGAGQIVIAGTRQAVERASARAKELGAKKIVPLAVSAPFHCALMKPAEDRLAPELRSLSIRDPRVPVVANVDALPKHDAHAAIEGLVRQVSNTVRWEESVQRLASDGVTAYVEVGPGTVLSSLIRKIQRQAATATFAAPDDLAGARSVLGRTDDLTQSEARNPVDTHHVATPAPDPAD